MEPSATRDRTIEFFYVGHLAEADVASLADTLHEHFPTASISRFPFEPPMAGGPDVAMTLSIALGTGAGLNVLSGFFSELGKDAYRLFRSRVLALFPKARRGEHGRPYIPFRVMAGPLSFHFEDGLTDAMFCARLEHAAVELPQIVLNILTVVHLGPEWSLSWDDQSGAWQPAATQMAYASPPPMHLVPPDRGRLPPVVVRQPQAYDIVDDPVHVCGFGTGFEGAFQARVRDATGRTLDESPITAGGMGAWGTFHLALSLFSVPSTPAGVVEIFEVSPKDGSELSRATVPVVFGRALINPYHGFAQYTVSEGDTLATIAQHWYGEAGLQSRLFEANRSQLDISEALSAGQVLRIPQ